MESGDKQIEYISETAFKTSDHYKVNIKAVVNYIGETEKNIFSAIQHALQEHMATISLMDALDLVNETKYQQLLTPINRRLESDQVKDFAIKTVDAVETGKEIDISIDPNLESQKQRKGIFGKIKSLFDN